MLDDESLLSEIDKSHMFDVLSHYPNHINEAVRLANEASFDNFMKIDNVVITGMGASAISGDMIVNLYRDKIDIPIVVNRDYDLPRWSHKDTLTIFVSYSGNTEETLSSFKIAYQKKCKIICISSGGKLQKMCEKRDVCHIKIPSGFQPRAATMYILFPLILILKRVNVIKNDIENDIKETLSVVEKFINSNKLSTPEKDNQSKQVARSLLNTIPQIYGWGIYSPIAVRWRQQFNENSKIIARAETIPESNHNDIVGWSMNAESSKLFTCILFRDKNEESVYISTRLNFCSTLFKDVAGNVIEVHPRGKSSLAKLIYIMCLGDFSSCYLAILRRIDPSPVDIITELKKRLAEI
jgi:glucose/mannose-6-phosphate isomerase